ncbi:hypothetical protein CHU70_11050 (plasmid) [Corynebacterium sp. LK10]|uniref:hypothetical protein n=1 Tax=Corynebacterium sp. LK10 TaxID=2022656 RepID=UPI0011CBD699|nr:hypothetical protein [Corynebacterium sp. LK10]TXS81796.1 hypothetical protein CHU70_11050 [Corynebacterium sp. LK10]
MSRLSPLATLLPQLPEMGPLEPNTTYLISAGVFFDGTGAKLHTDIVPASTTAFSDLTSNDKSPQLYLSMVLIFVFPNISDSTSSESRSDIESFCRSLEGLLYNANVEGCYYVESIDYGAAVWSSSGEIVGHCGKDLEKSVETKWSMHDLLLLPTKITSAQAERAREAAESVYHAPESLSSPGQYRPPAIANCFSTYVNILDAIDTQPCVSDMIEHLLAAPEHIRCAAEICKYEQMRLTALELMSHTDYRERQLAFWSACVSLFTGNMRANAYNALGVIAYFIEDMELANRAKELADSAKENQ